MHDSIYYFFQDVAASRHATTIFGEELKMIFGRDIFQRAVVHHGRLCKRDLSLSCDSSLGGQKLDTSSAFDYSTLISSIEGEYGTRRILVSVSLAPISQQC